jgi:hypothetical protein
MASLIMLRPASPREASVPAFSAVAVVTSTGTGAGDTPGRRERPWWRRLLTLAGPQPPHEIQSAGLERLLALLEAARAELSAGWVQGGWWSTPSRDGRQILLTGLAAGRSAPETVGAVCLVGALIRAGSGQGGDSEAGRAIDAVYDALWESRGQASATPGPGMLKVSSPQVRQAKTQALTRWNDTQGRTSDEVLAVLDRAIARVIQDLAALPAPSLPSLDDHLGAAARTALSAVRASAVHCGEFQRRATCSAALK